MKKRKIRWLNGQSEEYDIIQIESVTPEVRDAVKIGEWRYEPPKVNKGDKLGLNFNEFFIPVNNRVLDEILYYGDKALMVVKLGKEGCIVNLLTGDPEGYIYFEGGYNIKDKL